MDMEKIRRLFELMPVVSGAWERRRDAEKRISGYREVQLGRLKAKDHPEYKQLMAEERVLYEEFRSLMPYLIRANLESMGIEDMAVTGVLYYSANEHLPGGGVRFKDGKEAGRIEMPLSELCGLRYGGLAGRLGIEPSTVSFSIQIEKDGKAIGHVDSDGRFQYEAAPDLRTAIGWTIATDGGRERLIEFFDLDKATQAVLDIIAENGPSKETFFNPYFNALERIFVYGRTSCFADGYCGVATVVWMAATRQLGSEHEGYPFGH